MFAMNVQFDCCVVLIVVYLTQLSDCVSQFSASKKPQTSSISNEIPLYLHSICADNKIIDLASTLC